MDFKDIFISLVDSVLELDKDNKYALKYKNNFEVLKYSDLSDFIYNEIKEIDSLENKTYLDFMKIIKDFKDKSFIPGFTNNYFISLDNEKLFKM